MPIGSMGGLALAAVMLLATHFGLSSTPLRDRLVRAVQEGPYRGLYSLVALVVLVWLVLAYRAAPSGPLLWNLYPVGNYLALILMPVALILAVGGFSSPNPTAIGGERQLGEPDPVRGVQRITRNPVMWGVGLWALGHVASNGDLASVIFFGALAVLALLGSVLIDVKNRRRRPVLFAPFELATSNVPFLAILQGRQSFARAAREFGPVRLGIAVLLFAVLLHGHGWLFGASPLPG